MINVKQNFCFPAQEEIRAAYEIEEGRIENGRYTFDVCYDLEKVFNKDTYKNSKKYNQHISRYLNYATNNELFVKDIETEEEKKAAYDLYQDWWNVKMEADRENPNHFEEHSERYKYCMDYTFEKKFPNLQAIGLFTKDGKLLAFQTLVLKDDWAYDMSNANSRTDYAYIAEVSLVNFLKYLKEQKSIKFYNFGETGGDLGLLRYKEKLPNFRIYYGKLNVTFKKSTKDDTEMLIDLMNRTSTPENPFPTEYMPATIEAGNVIYADVNGKLAGMVECRNKNGKYLMTNLITEEFYRGQGIGAALLEQLPKPFEFFCYKTNEKALKFYENLKNVKRLPEKDDDKLYWFEYD